MARKNNIRSMRFSDDMIEMIEAQQGRNFSEKFENLVTRCMWELPEKEKRLAVLDEEIKRKNEQLLKLSHRIDSELSRCYSLVVNLSQSLSLIDKDL